MTIRFGDPSIQASNPEASAWVAAHAGAGKTHTLASRVTRLLLAGVKPEKILCLTYTKAAAAEMSGRLFDQLGAWSMLADAELRQKIETIGGRANGTEALENARRLFAMALETPGGLKINTIHAFCQTLLSRFPLEAGIPPFFQVLDDQTAHALMQDARTVVLARANRGDARLASAIAFVAQETSEAQLTDIVQAALGPDRRKLEALIDEIEWETLRDHVRKAHEAGPEDYQSLMRNFVGDQRREAPRWREIVTWLGEGTKTDQKWSVHLSRMVEEDFATEHFFTLGEVFLTGERTERAKLATKGREEARPDLLQFYQTVRDDFVRTEKAVRSARASQLCEAALTIAHAVNVEYARAKRARAGLDYHDLIAGAKTLLEDSQAAQWVLYKLDGGIDHILIDEAQDTSPEQWQIVRQLTGEFFSGVGTGGEEKIRTLFAVGDEKQSIFSFQGAVPDRFGENRVYFHGLAANIHHRFEALDLTESRRSAPEVLRFVDEVFADPAVAAGLTYPGTELKPHDVFRKDAKGCVEFWPTLRPDEKEKRDHWLAVDAVQENSPVAELSRRIAERIGDWLTSGATLPGHDKPIRPGDIMILLRKRDPFGPQIIRALKERNIPVAGADRIRLTEQIAVMDLIALGRFVLLPDDDLNLAALLRSPLVDISEEQLYALAHGRKGSLWQQIQSLKDSEQCAGNAYEFLSDMLGRADYAPPFEFYSHALVTLGLREPLLARLGADANDAVDEFLSLAFSYEGQNTPSLQSFLQWVEAGEVEIKRDMERGRDEVRVMTVHGAKGLEADIVFLPDTCSEPMDRSHGSLLYRADAALYPLARKDAPDSVQAAKEEAAIERGNEYRRLLYVALTRARDMLIVAGAEGKNARTPSCWYSLMEKAATTLGTETIRDGMTIRRFGTPETRGSGATAPAAAPAQIIPAWATSTPIVEPPRPRLIRPSEIGAQSEVISSPLGKENPSRFKRGNLVHTLLAHLPDVAPAMRAEKAREYLVRQKLEGEAAETLIAETLAVLSDPVFAPAFAPGSRAEVAIAALLPDLGRITGRIDRLAVTDGHVLIVDFKTNRPPPRVEEKVPPLYIRQMALYRAAVEQIFPGKRIAAALVWTDGPFLMPLSEALMDAEKSAFVPAP